MLCSAGTEPVFGRGIKKLKGQYKGYHRITTDGYRIIYRVEKGSMTVSVVSIGPRGDVYK
ncbi:MAG TPA: type II toxin-antitoxin system RelE/ParE family toxin [Desulfotomaculum sp.]|nr:type II toxin-antitoxin system RelE/ParE family toxin [Desulfotomaculum sp.]